jgi:MFS transporter, putative metabolite:H+ symporter
MAPANRLPGVAPRPGTDRPLAPVDLPSGRPRATADPAADRERRYLRLMMWLLLPAAFFNGFDGELRALLLKDIQNNFHVGVSTLGLASIPIAAGQFAAFFVIRTADRIGRRPLLLVTLLGYTVFTGLTALSWSIWSFVVFQFFAQVCIGTEFSMAVTVVSEEFTPAVRGRAIGRLLIAGPLGAIFVALLLGAKLDQTVLGWRAFYLIGLIPLVLAVVMRRLLHETHAFEAAAARRRALASPPLRSFLEAWRPPWRSRVLALGAVSLLQKIPANAGAGWWVYYAETQRHYPKSLVSLFLVAAYGLGTSGYYVCGRAIDRFGRKPTAVVYLALGAVLGAILFQTSNREVSFVLLIGATFFALGIGPALSAFGAELFPTEIRAQASGWVGNGFASTGAILGQSLVGILGAKGALIGNIGNTVSLLTLLALVAIPIVLFCLPETRGIRLDEGDPLSAPATG